MNKSFIYTLGIVSIFLPWFALFFLIWAALALRGLPFEDLGILGQILFVILPLICIGIQCVCLKKKILRIPIMINFIFWILLITWVVIQNREIQHQQTLFQESHDRYMEKVICDGGCYQDTLESFFEKKNIAIIRNLKRSHLESIIGNWTHDDGTRNGEHIEIVKVGGKIYYVNKHVGKGDINYLLPLHISANGNYIFFGMAYGTSSPEWKDKEDQENLIPNTNKRLIYITSNGLEVIDLGEDSYKGDATVADELKGSHKFYPR